MSDLERAKAIYREACVMPQDQVVEVIALHIAAARAEGESAERERCVAILHEEGWVGRSEQRIAHPPTRKGE